MRIAVNAALLGNRHSGVTTYIIGLIQSLSRLGHEVVVYGSSCHLPVGTGITIHRTPRSIAYDAGPFAGFLRLLWNLFVLPAKILGGSVDVIVSQNAEGAIWCSVPQVLIIHDLVPLFYPEEAPRLRSYYKRLLPLVLKHTAAVIAVSQYTRGDILQHYKINPANVHYCYNGVEQASGETEQGRRPANAPSSPYFLFVGTFAPRKNLETLVRALARIQSQVPHSLVIVAYADQWAHGLMRLAKELELGDRVVHLSGLSQQELEYVYHHATALFLLSEYEGFGFPALEAMVAGTPVVVSDSTALAEVAGCAALKISAHDIHAVAEAMLRLFTDNSYREKWQTLGSERAQAFTWDRLGCRVSDILSQVVQSRQAELGSTETPR